MTSVVPRYLVPFHPKHIPHHFVDVLVIGGGIAGMRATMAIDPQLSALVVTKDRLPSAHFEHTVVVGKEKAEILTIPETSGL
jgi:L-aspartate oxidase